MRFLNPSEASSEHRKTRNRGWFSKSERSEGVLVWPPQAPKILNSMLNSRAIYVEVEESSGGESLQLIFDT